MTMEALSLGLRLTVAGMLILAGILKFSIGMQRLMEKVSAFRLVPTFDRLTTRGATSCN
ncbi:MAG: hypothetical protein QM582_10435 [Micropruina sp.]|uniref:hypothetical protein n=1 Tax=Micropruina sp. TaxID=2737536 RepID=UPI0039E47277